MMTRAHPQSRFGKQNFCKDRPMCTHCGFMVHDVEKCYKLHGYPPRYKSNKNKMNISSAKHVQNQGNNNPHNTKVTKK